MTTSPDDRPHPSQSEPPRRSYEKPRLTDYGLVSKLTLTGGITTRDTGNMKRHCL
jgi:hypothetical protein